MKTLNLCLHAGGSTVERDELARVVTPAATRTWCPIPHERLVTGVQTALERSGLRVVAEAHGLANEGDRYFGLLQLANGHNPDDYGLVVGLRNSHDQRFPAGMVVGSGVFVCDNLAFSGEIKISRKHTTFILRDLPQLIESAVGRLAEVRGRQDCRIAAYKQRELVDAQAHDLIVQALDAGIVPVTRIPAVLTEWRTPRHAEFAEGRTAWRLFNAFTEALKPAEGEGLGRLARLPRATQALHGLLDTTCGVLN